MQDHSGMTLTSENAPISDDRATSRPSMVHTKSAVELRALHEQCAGLAQILQTAATELAPAAARYERGDDVVAGLEAAHSGADRFDHSRALVASAVREVRDLSVRLGHVVVRVAQTGSHHSHQHLVVLGLVHLHVDYLPLAGLLHQQRSSASHRSLL